MQSKAAPGEPLECLPAVALERQKWNLHLSNNVKTPKAIPGPKTLSSTHRLTQTFSLFSSEGRWLSLHNGGSEPRGLSDLLKAVSRRVEFNKLFRVL
jgi:hypothetical protein